MAGLPVDYYATLEVDPKASQQQIKDAYKKAALKHHPDRVPVDSPERPARTKRFQQINDAYYTLCDPERRRDYDSTRAFHSSTAPNFGFDTAEDETAGSHENQGFKWSSFFGRHGAQSAQSSEQFSHDQFGSVFEEMMRDEGMAEGEQAAPTGKFWSVVGGVSGGAMGFIVANFSGAVAGAVAGNRLGAIRDKKGKSVYAVFQELDQGDRARLLGDLAAKVFASAVSG